MDDPKPLIGPHGGYRKTYSFGLTCLVYHATTRFCGRVYDYKNDPLGKTSGQMIGAARSARQNIVEGSARAGTSKSTELRLLDVAQASLEELCGDYEVFCVDRDVPLWSQTDAQYKEVTALVYDPFTATTDTAHAFCCHIIAMRKRFAPWLENTDPVTAANAIFYTAHRAQFLLAKQIDQISREIIEHGGFSENMAKRRVEHRDAPPPGQPPPPACPACGKTMRQRIAKKGPNTGKAFWACSGYPECTGTREVEKGDVTA